MKVKNLFTLQDFYDFFEAIPESSWCTDAFSCGSTHCAFGHLGAKDGKDVYLENSMPARFRQLMGGAGPVYHANDTDISLGSTPKYRILELINRRISGEVLW